VRGGDEADLTCAGQLSALITAQLSRGTRQLTIDVSELWFADSASIRTLVLAARRLRERGGSLVLLRPRQPVARVLALTGAEQMFTIRGETHGIRLAATLRGVMLVRSRTYEITIVGRAGDTLRAAFDDCTVTVGPGRTILRARLPDQAALWGLLQRITGLGLEVVGLRLVASESR
jgi:anti-sigma B factor antagonist